MTQRGASLKKLSDAVAPLYKSLDEGQKHRFVMLAHLEGRDFDGKGGRHGYRGWMHRGQGGAERGPMGPEGGPRPQ
jgi:zinc resistance-associated protein